MPQPQTPTRIHARAPSLEIDAYETAITLLGGGTFGPMSELGKHWRDRAAAHLTRKLDTELHGNVPSYSHELVALSVIKGCARDLRTAASALHTAAERLRAAGDGFGANRTYHASLDTKAAADAIDPA